MLAARRAGGVAAPDPYTVLGLAPGTRDEKEVRRAARRLVKLYHPDVPGTGDAEKFQEVQNAIKSLMEPGTANYQLQSSLEKVYHWSANPAHSHRYGSQAPPSSAAKPLVQNDFANSRHVHGARVDVAAVAARRRTDLKKGPKLKHVTHEATPETLARVQAALSASLGAPLESVAPGAVLEQLGFILEGHTGTIGYQPVAEAALALEEEFGVELMSILVRTWIKFSAPEGIYTVQDMANFVESKLNQ